jgi:hypothetical protein
MEINKTNILLIIIILLLSLIIYQSNQTRNIKWQYEIVSYPDLSLTYNFKLLNEKGCFIDDTRRVIYDNTTARYEFLIRCPKT